MTTTSVTFDQLQGLDAQHVMQTYTRQPVAFVRGQGSVLWDSEGKRYLDFLSGLAVTSLGHAHPAVADAVAEQARTLLHVSNLYLNDLQPRLAARLDVLLGGGGQVFFANSGAEANECAVKLARRYGQTHGGPGRHHVVAAYGSFHGRTLATLAATGQPQKHEPFQPLPPGFLHVPFGDLEALANAVDERVCAVLLEPVQGEGGVQPAPAGYLEAVRTLCDEREALLVIDEVQTGLGRTGRWFGFEHAEGVRPDVVTLAKALGNGVPIGACWARADVASAFRPGEHAIDVRRSAPRGASRPRGPRRHGGRRRAGPRGSCRGPHHERTRRCARHRRRARRWSADRGRARRGHRRGRCCRSLPRCRSRRERGDADRAPPRTVRSSSPTRRSTKPSPSSRGVLAEVTA